MVLYLYKEKAKLGELQPALKVLHATGERFGGIIHVGYDFGTCYNL